MFTGVGSRPYPAGGLTAARPDRSGRIVDRHLEGHRTGEFELNESEERFRLLVEGTKDYAIFMLDPGGHIISWNAGARRIKGYAEHEVIGKHFSVFYTRTDI